MDDLMQKQQQLRQFIKEILIIVGHAGEELEQYSYRLLWKITQQVGVDALANMDEEKKLAFNPDWNQDATAEEIMQVLIKHLTREQISEGFADASEAILGEYLDAIVDDLSEEQQKQLEDLMIKFADGE